VSQLATGRAFGICHWDFFSIRIQGLVIILSSAPPSFIKLTEYRLLERLLKPVASRPPVWYKQAGLNEFVGALGGPARHSPDKVGAEAGVVQW
jgi:hypothetical protein